MSLTAHVVYEQDKEGVNDECFVHISRKIDIKGAVTGVEGNKRGDCVDRDHEQDTQSVSLSRRTAVVVQMLQ